MVLTASPAFAEKPARAAVPMQLPQTRMIVGTPAIVGN